ncbi:hypothetical protein ULF88_11015 [Halopseudomonas pachastrellae]|nr:hypothetical protein [Halopseudomonas pachastrellae]
MARFLEQVFARFADPLDALAAWIDSALQRIAASRFKLGCPLAAAALDCSPEDTDLLLALHGAFTNLRDQLAGHISRAGFPTDAATDLAVLVLTSYEGRLDDGSRRRQHRPYRTRLPSPAQPRSPATEGTRPWPLTHSLRAPSSWPPPMAIRWPPPCIRPANPSAKFWSAAPPVYRRAFTAALPSTRPATATPP